MSIDAGARAPLASNRSLGSCILRGYKRSCGFTPEVVIVDCPIIGRYGVNPMDAFGSHE